MSLARPARRRQARHAQRGSTLIEVLVAVVLFSVGVIGLLRSLGTVVQDTGAIQYRSVASTVADSLLGRMWVDRANLAAYAGDEVAVPELPNGARTVNVAGNVVTITITWQAPGAARPSNHQVSATIASN